MNPRLGSTIVGMVAAMLVSGCFLRGLIPGISGYGMAPLAEGHGIKKLPAIALDPTTEGIRWEGPLYWIQSPKGASHGRLGEQPERFPDPLGPATQVVFSQDGQRAAVACPEGTLHPVPPHSSLFPNTLYDVYLWEASGAVQKVKGAVLEALVSLSPDGKELAIQQLVGQSMASSSTELIGLDSDETHSLSGTPGWGSTWLWSGDSLVCISGQKITVPDASKSFNGPPWDCSHPAGLSTKDDTLYCDSAWSAVSLDNGDIATISFDLPPGGGIQTAQLSPDGTQVAFQVGEMNEPPAGIAIAPIHGGPAKMVTPPADLVSWADATTLVVSTHDDKNNETFYTVDLTQR